MTKSITIKLPDEVHKRLVGWASEDYRTLTAQIIFVLAKASEEWEKEKEQEKEGKIDTK